VVSSRALVSAAGVPSAGAFGSSTLQTGTWVITVAGIASGGALGASILSYRNTVTPTGVASTEAHGVSRFTLYLRPAGLASAGAMGAAPLLTLYLRPSGVSTGEAHGTSGVSSVASLAPAGVGSVEAFGAAVFSARAFLAADPIPSGEYVPGEDGFPHQAKHPSSRLLPTGSASGQFVQADGWTVAAPGLASTEAVSAPLVSSLVVLGVVGIPSAGAFGSSVFGRVLAAAGVPSAAAVGSATFQFLLAAAGVVSGESFGASLFTASATIAPSGVAASDAYGVARLGVGINPTGVDTAAAFGTAAFSTRAFVSPAGFFTPELFGLAGFTTAAAILPPGVQSAENVPGVGGFPGARRHPSAGAYPTGSSTGAIVQAGAWSILQTGIPTAEQLGPPTLLSSSSIAPSGIDSLESHGVARLRLYLVASGVASGAQYGQSRFTLYLRPAGMPTGEQHGSSALGAFSRLAPSGVASGEFVPGVSGLPSSLRYPSASSFPSTADTGVVLTRSVVSIAALAIPPGEQFGLPAFGMFARVAALGVPSTETIPGLSGLPSPRRYPSATAWPSPESGVRLLAGSVSILTLAILSGELHGANLVGRLLFIPPPPSGAVGPPRHGLRPGPGKQPGHISDTGSDLDSPVTYRRIRYPSATINPSRGLYPARWDFTPKNRRGWFVVTGRQSWDVVRNRRYRTFVASIHGAGFFNAHGVFSSDVYGKIPTVVELADGSLTVDLGGDAEAVELASIDLELELA
jgi:hypothetical protein